MNENEQPDIYLSIVAPAYNEAQNLRRLIEESTAAGDAVGSEYEIIIANDASDDRTPAVLAALMKEYPRLRVLDLQQRSGQTAALDAAIRAAGGRYIATLDADLQNDPRDIPRLLEPIENDECDYVNGWRRERQDSPFRLLVSRYGNAFRNLITMEQINDSGCGIKVFRRECADRLKLFDGGHRFFATLVRMDGWRVAEMAVNHRPRRAGRGKYGFLDRFFKVVSDALAVRWMRKKTVRWRATERGPKNGSSA